MHVNFCEKIPKIGFFMAKSKLVVRYKINSISVFFEKKRTRRRKKHSDSLILLFFPLLVHFFSENAEIAKLAKF